MCTAFVAVSNMPFITATSDAIALGCGRKIWVSHFDEEAVSDLEIPALPKAGEEELDINIAAFSCNAKYFAVCDNYKRLSVFTHSRDGWTIVKNFDVERKCVKLLFDKDNANLIVADKSGDVYTFSLDSTVPSKGRLLMGHLSMLLDISFTPSFKFLLTSDRDEKVRLSHYPNSYNIENFCLGHKDFVSSLCVLSDELLLSGSGDGTIRLWNYMTGKEIYTRNTSEDAGSQEVLPVRFVRKINADTCAVQFYNHTKTLIYRVSATDISLEEVVNLISEPLFTVSIRNTLLSILSKATPESGVTHIFEKSADNTLAAKVSSFVNSNTAFVDSLANVSVAKELETLHKQWFDNVESYMQKKKEREENQREPKKVRRE